VFSVQIWATEFEPIFILTSDPTNAVRRTKYFQTPKEQTVRKQTEPAALSADEILKAIESSVTEIATLRAADKKFVNEQNAETKTFRAEQAAETKAFRAQTAANILTLQNEIKQLKTALSALKKTRLI
jgi:thymidylate synthase